MIALLLSVTDYEAWIDEESAESATQSVLGLIEKLCGTGVIVSEGFIGEVRMFAMQSVPTGWLRCEGQTVSSLDYPALFDAIQYTYGTGVYSHEFKLPDLQTRVVVGRGAPPNGNSTSKTIGYSGGEERVTLTTDQIPSHSHGQRGNSGGAGAVRTAGVTGAGDINHASTTQNAGGGQSHNNMQPYIVLQYAIKAV